MEWELEKRQCNFPGCRHPGFSVLASSKQRHCSIPHDPAGPRTHQQAVREAINKAKETKRRTRYRVIGRVKALYAEGLTSPEVLVKLKAEGVKKEYGATTPIDIHWLESFRARNKIRIPPKPKPG